VVTGGAFIAIGGFRSAAKADEPGTSKAAAVNKVRFITLPTLYSRFLMLLALISCTTSTIVALSA
jgi:hypothetical protein